MELAGTVFVTAKYSTPFHLLRCSYLNETVDYQTVILKVVKAASNQPRLLT